MVRVQGETWQEAKRNHEYVNIDYWFELAVADCHTRRKAAIMRAAQAVREV